MIKEQWSSWGEAKSFNVMTIVKKTDGLLTSRGRDTALRYWVQATDHLDCGDFPKAMHEQDAALHLRKGWWPKVSCTRSMREVARVNSRFRESGDGRINDGCIQKVGKSEGIDGSGIGLVLVMLVLFRLPCFKVLTMIALLLFTLIPSRSPLLWPLLLLLELGVLFLVLHHTELVSGFTLRRALVDVLLPCKGGHMLNGSKVRDGRSRRSGGSGRGGGGMSLFTAILIRWVMTFM